MIRQDTEYTERLYYSVSKSQPVWLNLFAEEFKRLSNDCAVRSVQKREKLTRKLLAE